MLWHKSICDDSSERVFEEIIGENDIKRILLKAIMSNKPVHILLMGSPASAKTMFLTQVIRRFKSSLFVVGSNTAKAGLGK